MENPIVWALIATLGTWAVTAAGAATVFLFRRPSPEAMNRMLGFSAGVMIAASFWSLLQPAIARAAEQEGKSMLVAALTSENIDPRAMKKIKPFADTMGEFIALSRTMPLSEFTWGMISALEYETYLKAEDKRGEVESRMDNLRELIGNIKEIEKDLPEGEDALRAFLENVSLVSDIDSMNDGNGAVALMTLHSAKGLEFPKS